MKSWKAMGLFFLVLVVSGLIFGCSDDPPPFYAGSGGGGKTAKGYQVRHWFEKDENAIARAEEMVEMCKANLERRGGWIYGSAVWGTDLEQAQRQLENAHRRRNLKVEIKGPATDLIVMIIKPDGSALITRSIDKKEMMDNIEVVNFGIWRTEDYDIKKAEVHSLVIKTFEPERVIYRVDIKLPPIED